MREPLANTTTELDRLSLVEHLPALYEAAAGLLLDGYTLQVIRHQNPEKLRELALALQPIEEYMSPLQCLTYGELPGILRGILKEQTNAEP